MMHDIQDGDDKKPEEMTTGEALETGAEKGAEDAKEANEAEKAPEAGEEKAA